MDFSSTFNCNGRVNHNDWQLTKDGPFLRGEVESVLYPQEDYPLSSADVQLFDCIVPAATGVLNLKHFIKCMLVQLKIVNRYEKCTQVLNSARDEDIDFYQIRRTVCDFLSYIRIYLHSIKWDLYSLRDINPEIEEDFNLLFSTIKQFLIRLRNIPDSTFHYAPSNLGNKCKLPEFHVYHMHIELRWLFVTLAYTRNIYCNFSMENQSDDFEYIQGMIISDLMYISLQVFERASLTELRQKTPYNCTCIRELWLMLQIFTDSLSERMKSKTFWDHVNECVDRLLDKKTPENNEVFSCYSLPRCKNLELFCLWIMYHLTLLYGYNIDGVYLGSSCSRIRANTEQIEKILKTYVSKGGKDGERDEIDDELCTMMPLLSVLVIDWCQPRVSIVSLLWDCFHKRLDEPFLLQTSGPWTLSVEKKTAADILKQVKDRIDNTEYVKESSYGMFLRLLGSFLKKYYSSNDTKHWNQIKGRIYSKFSRSKVAEFSVTGLYNFLSLFITLAVAADTTNVCSVMLDLLPSTKEFNAETSKKYVLIWKGKLSILLLYNNLRLNFNSIAPSFIDTVNAISCRKDETSCSMMISFVDVFSTILLSSEKIELGEYSLVGGWIDRYLLECPKKMIGTLIRVLVRIFEKCVSLNLNTPNLDGVGRMLDVLWSYVACRVRQLVFDPNLIGDHYQDLSKLAVLFTLDALRDPALAKKHKHSATSLLQHFVSSVIVKDIRITRYYLALLLEREQAVQDLRKEIKNFDTLLVQAWVKCSILGHDSNKNEIKTLQDYILQLNDIKQIFSTSLDVREFQNSNEPILIFMMYSMKKRNTLKSDQERNQYDARWRQYFNHIEKWILSSVSEESKDSEHAFWIYKCIGTLVLCTAPMLYTKVQPNNMLRNLLNKAVITSEHSSQSFVNHLGRKIFSMILLGIETLNVKGDISLQALIRDLFDQYMPHLIIATNNSNTFKVSDSLLKCFRDSKMEFLRLIFEMLMSNFFTILSDNTMHKHSYLVMILLRNLLKAEKIYASYVTEFIITICTSHVVGCYMKVHERHPHKQHTIEFVNNIVTNSYYKENISTREKFNDVISIVVQRYLTTYQQSTFELLRSISLIKVDIIKHLHPQIERILNDLERNRRPNAASLRYSWNQLQGFIKNAGGSPR